MFAADGVQNSSNQRSRKQNAYSKSHSSRRERKRVCRLGPFGFVARYRSRKPGRDLIGAREEISPKVGRRRDSCRNDVHILCFRALCGAPHARDRPTSERKKQRCPHSAPRSSPQLIVRLALERMGVCRHAADRPWDTVITPSRSLCSRSKSSPSFMLRPRQSRLGARWTLTAYGTIFLIPRRRKSKTNRPGLLRLRPVQVFEDCASFVEALR